MFAKKVIRSFFPSLILKLFIKHNICIFHFLRVPHLIATLRGIGAPGLLFIVSKTFSDTMAY